MLSSLLLDVQPSSSFWSELPPGSFPPPAISCQREGELCCLLGGISRASAPLVPCRLPFPAVAHAHGYVHTRVPVCASRARDIAALSLCTVGQDSWALFSPYPAHCHGKDRGAVCAGHGANMDYDNLHFCYFLFPGKRGKVKPVLTTVGCIVPYSKAMV